ncbi:macrophage mannose receptor 1-like protein [Lates japonicus]|uniref:Macrophage mannose receptor 1-like protein n=1 Tax=Lates japonicus TaxID=270547 RepID=A0AAD3MGM4_LATJO|nr:macrophage mannose receptor 1-like protein [Lates japonicus]
MIESSAENEQVSLVKPADTLVWIGLYRVPWTWSDMSQGSFRLWRSGAPNNNGGSQFCMAEDNLHYWEDNMCSAPIPFICHQALKFRNVVRMKIVTDADITDPAVNAQILQQLSAVLTSQGWTDFKLQWKILPIKQKEN